MSHFFTKASLSVIGIWFLCLVFQFPSEHTFLFWRHQLTILSGALALVYMTLSMVLAVRPKRLERFFGGLDHMYAQHKYFGIGSLVLVIVHWLVIKSAKIAMLMEWIEKPAGRRQRPQIDGVNWHAIAKQLGEISMYLLIAIVIISLVQAISYRRFRWTHKLSGLVFIMAAIHSVLLLDLEFASIPLDTLIISASLLGCCCAFISLSGRIGKARKITGLVDKLTRHSDTIELKICAQQSNQQPPTAGQFYFLNFKDGEAAHPFTLVNYDAKDSSYEFAIKALGDYTSVLIEKLQLQTTVELEGPYGRFQPPSEPRQVWMGVGIGIAPFIAWLEAIERDDKAVQKLKGCQIDLFYCAGSQDQAYFLERINKLAKAFNNIRVEVLYSSQGQRVNAQFIEDKLAHQSYSLSYCGPKKRLKQLRKSLQEKEISPAHIYTESFEMR